MKHKLPTTSQLAPPHPSSSEKFWVRTSTGKPQTAPVRFQTCEVSVRERQISWACGKWSSGCRLWLIYWLIYLFIGSIDWLIDLFIYLFIYYDWVQDLKVPMRLDLT